MDNKCIFSRKEDGICEYKNEVRTSQSEVQKTSIKLMQSPRETTAQVLEKRETDEKEEKELYLDNIIKKRLQILNKEKSKKYHRASSDCDSSDEEKDEPYYHGSKASTTLTREQA